MSELENAVGELRRLARKEHLDREELERAKDSMRELRRMGFSSEEISELSERTWSPSTIRQYAASVKVEKGTRDLAIKMLAELVERGLTLSDVEMFLGMRKRLEELGISFEEFTNLLEELRRKNIELRDLIHVQRMLEDGLTSEEIESAVSCKSELQKLGINVDHVKRIVEVSKFYGGLNEFLEAVEKFKELKSIRSELEKLEVLKRSLNSRIRELREEISNLEERRSKIKYALNLFGELKKRGFDERALEVLRKAAEKYGGVKEVLTAVNTFGKVKEIERKIFEAEKIKSEVEAELKLLKADYVHLQTVVKLCDELLYKHGFTIQAITDVYEIAKRYGNPIEVIKTIEKYGSIRELDEEIKKLEVRRKELEARISELEEQTQVMRRRVGEVKKFVEEVFEASANAIRRKIEETIDSIASGYEEYARRLGELKREAGKFEKELEFARVFNTLLMHPEAIKEPQKHFCSVALRAIYNHCIRVGYNPTVKVYESVREKVVYDKKVTLLEVLELALKAFRL
ncbi:hypothetical protein DRP07_00530 [Archaeoglobales archaeon]|nr:MAG: hypothetical protein DRP07_00530 [Archaeoglobales archaeon]